MAIRTEDQKEKRKIYNILNADKLREQARNRYAKNSNIISVAKRERYKSDPEYKDKILKYCVNYRKKNPETNRKWAQKNKQHRKEYSQSKERLEYQRKYRTTDARSIALTKFNNKPERKETMRLYQIERRKDPIQNIKDRLNRRIHHALKQFKETKKMRSVDFIGCDIDSLMIHLSSTFKEGMSWENRGLWHIDHIKPCAMFDHSLITEILKCWNFSNLQALWKSENLKKSSNYKGEHKLVHKLHELHE